MHKYNSYITLTINDQHLKDSYTLEHRTFQLFMKRLRKALSREVQFNGQPGTSPFNALLHSRHGGSPHTPSRIAFYMAGEYGEQFSRPHYHAILFGVDFADRLYLKRTPSGAKIYRSPTLEKLWPLGYSSIGDVTFESAAYVARYIMKKQTGDKQNDLEILDITTGEIIKRKKEYNCMSRRPGVGSTWLMKYTSDVYTTGKVIIRGHQNNPPRYYDKLFKKLDRAALEDFQYARYVEQLAQTEHHTPERLAVQEQVAEAKIKSLKRNLT